MQTAGLTSFAFSVFDFREDKRKELHGPLSSDESGQVEDEAALGRSPS